MSQLRHRGRMIGLVLVCVLLNADIGLGQTGPAEPRQTVFEISSWRIQRDTSLLSGAGRLLNLGVERALDRTFGPSGGHQGTAVSRRIATLYLIDLPIVAITHLAVHEAGHVARAADSGRPIVAIRVTQWPWPVPIARGVSRSAGPVVSVSDQLGVASAGEEAGDVQADAIADMIYSSGQADYLSWLQLAYAKLDLSFYVWTELRPSQLRDFDSFINSSRFGSDPSQYAFLFAQLKPVGGGLGTPFASLKSTASTLRSGVWLNFIDASLWSGLIGVYKYVSDGTRLGAVPMLRLHGLGVEPELHFTITPLGFERSASARVIQSKQVVQASVRWTETPSAGRLWALGGSAIIRRTAKIDPQFWVDVWQQPQAGVGYRLETGANLTRRFGPNVAFIGFRVGYKTKGFLRAAPLTSGPVGSVSFAIRF